jgi:hypothetical protein
VAAANAATVQALGLVDLHHRRLKLQGPVQGDLPNFWTRRSSASGGLLKNLVAADSLGSSMIRAGGDRMLGRKERLGGCLGLGSILLQVRQLEVELFEDRPRCGLAELVYLSLSISSARNSAARSLSSNAFRRGVSKLSLAYGNAP